MQENTDQRNSEYGHFTEMDISATKEGKDFHKKLNINSDQDDADKNSRFVNIIRENGTTNESAAKTLEMNRCSKNCRATFSQMGNSN